MTIMDLSDVTIFILYTPISVPLAILEKCDNYFFVFHVTYRCKWNYMD
jgi:hypothetical protein